MDAADGVAGDNPVSVLCDGTPLDCRVGAESCELGAALQVPEAQGSIIRAGEGTPPVRGDCHRRDRVLVALESTKFQPALQVPQAKRLVIRAGKGTPTLRCHRH